VGRLSSSILRPVRIHLSQLSRKRSSFHPQTYASTSHPSEDFIVPRKRSSFHPQTYASTSHPSEDFIVHQTLFVILLHAISDDTYRTSIDDYRYSKSLGKILPVNKSPSLTYLNYRYQHKLLTCNHVTLDHLVCEVIMRLTVISY
jgi:hypothetical protein